MGNTFIRQCCVCHSVWDPGKNEWMPYFDVIATASHTYCDVCLIEARRDLQEDDDA